MKKMNKAKMALFAFVLCLSVSVGATLAYFSDYEEASGGATLGLGGQTEITEGSDEANKHIVISNTGETNMIVRLAIFQNDYLTVTLEKSGDWEKVGDFYYYKRVLLPGEDTSAVDADLRTSWKGEEPEYDFDVTVVHESAQAVYNGEGLAVPAGWDEKGVAAIAIPEVQGKEGE